MRVGSKIINVAAFYTCVVALFLLGTVIGNQAVTTFSAMTPIDRHFRIVIDPGHGGEDGGAVSCTGKRESSFNLQIALRLNDMFHLLGFETVMIRTTDTAVYTKGETIVQKKVSDLQHRVRTVANTPNGILISIHQNTFPEEKYSGAQVFYAGSLNSEALAKQLQDDLVATVNPGSGRKEKKGSGIYLLDKIETTGVLVECGFLSNPSEEAKLCNPTYQKQLCGVIASSTARFLDCQ